MMKDDILTEADVKLLVNTFYDKVRKDEILAPIFEPIIKDNWEPHLMRMTDFWSTILLYTKKYKDDPMPKHLPLPIDQAHFDRWLQLSFIILTFINEFFTFDQNFHSLSSQ